MTREELRENFDFVRVYDKVRTLDRPMSGSGAIINRDVRLMNHDLCVRQADYEQQKEYNEIVREQNDMTLRSEGYDPDVTRGADGSLDLCACLWYIHCSDSHFPGVGLVPLFFLMKNNLSEIGN